MKLLKRTAFSLLGILLLILTIATILEKIYGTDFVNEYIYSSVPFVILWGVTAITSLLYIIKSKLHRQPVIFLLHLSLLFILAGAFTTWMLKCQQQSSAQPLLFDYSIPRREAVPS